MSSSTWATQMTYAAPAELVPDRYGRCDVFVHAAATFAFGPLEQVELGAWRQIQAVNVESALLLMHAARPPR